MLSNHLGKTLEYHRMARRSETHEAALREALGEQNLPLLEDFLKDQYHFHDRGDKGHVPVRPGHRPGAGSAVTAHSSGVSSAAFFDAVFWQPSFSW